MKVVATITCDVQDRYADRVSGLIDSRLAGLEKCIAGMTVEIEYAQSEFQADGRDEAAADRPARHGESPVPGKDGLLGRIAGKIGSKPERGRGSGKGVSEKRGPVGAKKPRK